MAAPNRVTQPIAPTVGHKLPRSGRLIHAFEFRRVYKHGQRARGSHLVVVALTRRSPGFRLGLSVSKAHGGAVRRNKIKRIFREAFRLRQHDLPAGFDLVLIPAVRALEPALEATADELVRLAAKAADRHRAKREEQASNP